VEKLLISGGKPLKGSVSVSGAKNAAVAIIPAALLVKGVCRIENVPDIVILYSASHPKTASVDESGVVTAHKEGTSLITVSLFSGTEARVLISVE